MQNAPIAFVTTRWSRVRRAGERVRGEAQDALASLCQDYWRPLYHFARRQGRSPEEAQDLTQGFLCELMERDFFARADQERGRFRSYLVSAFRKFMSSEHRDRSALKRGGGLVIVSFEAEAEMGRLPEPSDGLTPEWHYDRSWAQTLLERVFVRLREEYERAGRGEMHERLLPHLSGAGQRQASYAQLAAALGRSESAIASALHRMRQRYGELLRAEIAETVSTPEEAEDELRHLLRVLAR